MSLSPQSEAFVMHFGEMGSRWGFNRTVGQVYALLVINEEPLNADQIGELLSISRSNVSMSLKELQAWRLIQLRHIPGDRKDYFSSNGTVWEMANTVFEERRKRELEPTLSLLRSNLITEAESTEAKYAQEKMREIHDLLELIDQWSTSLSHLSPESLKALMKMGSGVTKMLELRDKIIDKKT